MRYAAESRQHFGYRPFRDLLPSRLGRITAGSSRHRGQRLVIGIRQADQGIDKPCDFAVVAEDSLIRGRWGGWEAVLTTTGRPGTARRGGSGKRDEKVYERNQW